ncbi:DUF2213 domain-containing protein [Serratia liquefaciens]|uniref:DUF2213 domain-containing protein n=1 Tax=Serratia liquefaciens TaxID=614 RepID=UPI0021C5999F|nr:DUF2213 domain-containing protein [Serratia liquefaciens]
MKLSSIHVKSLAINASNISTETIDGEEHYVIRGVVPIVDDIVMNGGLYPATEINKSYQTLEGKKMPAGHPKIGSEYVSAENPRAVNQYHIGAWQENVRKDGDRVVMDMYINKRYAGATEKGKRLIDRLDAMVNGEGVEPIHVSTGLLLQREQNSGKSKGKRHSWIARNLAFDHTAILLDEPGAGTPSEGVGIFVNSAGDKIGIEEVNLSDASDLTKEGLLNRTKFFISPNSQLSFDEIYQRISDVLNGDRDLNQRRWIDSIYPSYFIYEDQGKKYKQSYLIDESQIAQLVSEPIEVVKKVEYDEVKTNGERNPMKEKMIAALNSAGVKTEGLTDDQVWDAYNQQVQKSDGKGDPAGSQVNFAAITAAVNAAITPLTDKLEKLEGQLQANAEKDLTAKRQAVKTKFPFMTEVAINSLTGDALNDMFAQCQTSSGLNPAFQQVNADNDQWNDYDLNAGMEQEKK